MSLMTFTTWNIVAASFIIAAVAIYAVARSVRAAGWDGARANRAVALVTVLIGGWLAAALALTWNGAYTASLDRLPTIQFGIFVPIIAGVLLYRASSFVREIVAAVSQSWLIGIQTYRALGFNFLALYSASLIPGVFALPAGTGDIIVGVTALLIALAYAAGFPPSNGVVRAWNLFGIADLVVAVTTGFMSSPSALQVTAFDLPNTMIAEFPLALVPAFAVPLSILLHFASFARAASKEGNGARLAHA
jgi:hypothetical protein